MYAIGRLAVLTICFASSARADDAPAIYQSAPNFSNAIAGIGFAVTWSVDSATVPADGDIRLSIRFAGVANPDRVRRPPLREKPAFKAAFREIFDEGTSTARDAATFHYRLRPRDASLKDVPELAVAYYAPGRASVATKYLDAIPIVLTPSKVVPQPPRPLVAPERLFAWPTDDTGFRPGLAAWAVLAIGLMGLALVGLAIERVRNPEGARVARLRRVRAVRTVLDQLDRAARSPDPAAAALETLRGYLAARHGAVATSATPGDFVRALEAVGAAPERIDRVRKIATDADAERFAPVRSHADLPARVRRLILDWEGAA